MSLKFWLPLSRRPGLPKQIQREAGRLIEELESAGWKVDDALYSARSFGNWLIKLRRGEFTIELVKDRGQFSVSGPPVDELKKLGLGRVTEGLNEFSRLVLNAFGPSGQTG